MIFTLEQIDRAIELTLRKVVVDLGFWPDVTLYLPTNDVAGFEQAKADIEAAGKPLINVYGAGTGEARGERDANNITIDRKAVEWGDIGFSQPFFYQDYTEEGKKKYRKVQVSESVNDIPYEIRFLADDIRLDRNISVIINKAFSSRKFLYGVNEDLSLTPDGFWIMAEGNPVDLSDDNYIERLFRYKVKDVIITPLEVVKDNISAIETIEVIVDTSNGDSGVVVMTDPPPEPE